ncbi:hypothetical protein BH18GEM1_BH18GEM1_08480 [soil metagenome]
MSSADRWSRIEELFTALLEVPVGGRRAALEAVQDSDLRAEVGPLLEAHEELLSTNGDFLEQLDPSRAGALLERSDTPAEETAMMGRYRILRRLGSGGMGIVYQAHDPRLDRSVALKLLPPYLSADPVAVRRLKAEARAASALDHPNIETVYEIGETVDGRFFIAMAYYEGETLRLRVARGPMSVESVIDLGVQLAEGLSAAHHSGIVHRDIKPENLLVTQDSVLKIVDFGVAKVVKDGLASVGLPRGTAAYMSPEQTRGEAVDHRTDLWSVGVVLYEMLTGSRPFGGEGEALIHTIRNDRPPPLSTIRGNLPMWLVALVERCLEKDPGRRFESADALAMDLRKATISTPPAGLATRRGRTVGSRARQRLARIGATTVLAAVVLVVLLMRSGGKVAPSAMAEAIAPGIAVLPFEVRGEDLDVWREGMVDLLSTGLDGAAGLRAIDSRTVLARWTERVPESARPDLATSLQVARAAGARYAIQGSVVAVGTDLRLVADVYDVEEGRPLGQAQVEGSRDEILELIDRLAIASLGVITVKGLALPEIDLASSTTASLPALKAYLEGELHLRRGEFQLATAAYDRSVEADSSFALAWFSLGQAASWLEASSPRSMYAFNRAAALAHRLPEREAIALKGLRLDAEYLEPLRLAVRRYPDDARLWYVLGEMYYHRPEVTLVGPEEAARAFWRAIELEPRYAPYWSHVLDLAFSMEPDSARVAQVVEAYGRVAADVDAHRLAHALAFGDADTRARARAVLETADYSVLNTAFRVLDHPRYIEQAFSLLETRLRRAPPNDRPFVLYALARMSFQAGKVRRALEILDDSLLDLGPQFAPFVYCGPYRAFAHGLPIPPARLDRTLSIAAIDSAPRSWIGCIGAWAADRGRWEDHARVIETLREQGDSLLAEGDSVAARRLGATALALEGYAAWKHGRGEEAFRILDAARPDLAPYDLPTSLPFSWWMGLILLELGRPAEAARYFRARTLDPIAHYELAKICHVLGENAKARAEYEFFLEAWKDADPELQPMLANARKALAQLASERRE